MDYKKIPYESHRTVWRSEGFLRHFFGVKPEEKLNRENRYISNFLEKLKQIPDQRVYTFVGYGSIMNEGDVGRTLPSYRNHRHGFISGWKRTFNVGFNTAYLNVQKDESYDIDVALMEISYQDIPKLITRETLYGFKMVKTNEDRDALMVVGDTEYVDNTLDPQLNYLHLCLSGAKELGGLSAINNFLDESFCYSHVHCDQVTIREYLEELNIINYMIKNEYSSR